MVSDIERDRILSYVRHQASKPRADLVQLIRDGNRHLLDLVANLDEAEAARSPKVGEWSIRQLVLHAIGTQENMALTIANIARGRFAPLPRSGGPGFVPADDSRPYGYLVEHLKQSGEAMTAAVSHAPPEPDSSIQPVHSWFGPLDWAGWAVLQRTHDNDHRQHAQKIIDALRSGSQP
jgi:hypothetical protein